MFDQGMFGIDLKNQLFLLFSIFLLLLNINGLIVLFGTIYVFRCTISAIFFLLYYITFSKKILI